VATVEQYLDSEQRSQLSSLIVQAIADFWDGSISDLSDHGHVALAKSIAEDEDDDDWIGDLVTNAIDLEHRVTG